MLPEGEVHIWRATFASTTTRIQYLLSTFSNDERQRAGRFRHEQDRRRFITGRGLLREILGRYLKVVPEQIQFQYGAQGKPYLQTSANIANTAIQFNLAHSHNLILYAFAKGMNIGIDLEYIDPTINLEQLTRHFFSEKEIQILQALAQKQKREMFFKFWTQKEAYLKAIGQGLAYPLKALDVSGISNTSPKFVNGVGGNQATNPWYIQTFIPAPDYIMALAVDQENWSLRCWQHSG